jgi:hypothetical protein
VPPDPFRTVMEQEAAARSKAKNADDPETKAELQRRQQEQLANLEVSAVRAGFRTRLPREPIAVYRQAVDRHVAQQRAAARPEQEDAA